jgi:hypothetical protein
MNIQIKHRRSGTTLCQFEAVDFRDCLLQAIAGDANLSGADLRDADLSGADLSGADLSAFKNDLFDILLRAPNEIEALKTSVIEGKIDGTVYEGSCACLVGTIANARGADYRSLGNGIEPNGSRPAELWFWNIKRGDTPETSQIAQITIEWISEFSQLLELAKSGV